MEEIKSTNFIEEFINKDLADGKIEEVVTRFPPEPNGYCHIGKANAFCLTLGFKKNTTGS